MPVCEKCGKEYKYVHQCEYVCKCGRSFTNKQSYSSHCGRCKINLGKEPKDTFGDSRTWSKGKTVNDPVYGESIKKSSNNRIKHSLQDVFEGNVQMQSNRLKYRLVDEGYKEWKCECCGLTEWLGKPIPLELHHKDGDNTKNDLDNLELLCPNCHSLTDNYRWKKKFKKSKEGISG